MVLTVDLQAREWTIRCGLSAGYVVLGLCTQARFCLGNVDAQRACGWPGGSKVVLGRGPSGAARI